MALSDRELKLTAVVYCMQGAAKHLKETGRLPDRIGGLWNVFPMRLAIQERGTDPTLSADELAVYDAILRENRLPGGAVRLVDLQQQANSSDLTHEQGNQVTATRLKKSVAAKSASAGTSAISVEQLIARIEALPEAKLQSGTRKVWYSSQKEHWLGWLESYDEGGYYGRKQPGKDAKFAYNHIVNPQMLLWLIEAAGISEDRVAAAACAAEAGTTLMQKAGAVRKLVPWPDVAHALWPDEHVEQEPAASAPTPPSPPPPSRRPSRSRR